MFTLVLGFGAIALFPKALFCGESFFERDIQAFYRPAKSLVVPLTRASSGLLLWNPLFASGQPFAANPEHEVFHPLTALFFLLPFEWAFRLQVILPVIGAALSMFFLLDSFGQVGLVRLAQAGCRRPPRPVGASRTRTNAR